MGSGSHSAEIGTKTGASNSCYIDALYVLIMLCLVGKTGERKSVAFSLNDTNRAFNIAAAGLSGLNCFCPFLQMKCSSSGE